MSSTYFAWLIVTLIGLVDKAICEGPPGVRSWVGVSLVAFLTTDVGRTAGLGGRNLAEMWDFPFME